jgi:hypothetical protein
VLPHEHLRAELSRVDWSGSVALFAADDARLKELSAGSLRVALWAHALEGADAGNSALPFVRASQLEMQYVAALIALSLYRPAAASMRSMVEGVLYYSFFRSHPAELTTLLAPDGKFYMDKQEILDWHKVHTPFFRLRCDVLQLIDPLSKWYSRVSAITHGQLPGTWSSHAALGDVAPDANLIHAAISEHVIGTEVAHKVYLATVDTGVWSRIPTAHRRQLVDGISKPDLVRLSLPVV